MAARDDIEEVAKLHPGQPEAFKAVRTVQDIVDVVHSLLPDQAAA